MLLNARELKKLEKILLEERDRLSGTIRSIELDSREETGRDAAADLQSYAEAGTDNFDREVALNIASSESQRLQEVNDALDRIAKGTYGICEGSGKPIPKKRLEVNPAARYTVEYQEKLEKGFI